jgi:hypothetical protein
MIQIVIVIGWLFALGLMMYLATQAIKNRLSGGRRKKLEIGKLQKFRRHHHFDEKQHRWVRKHDGVTVIDDADEDRRFRLTFFLLLLFILWEGYWLWEIVERFRNASHPLELPYGFLFFILVVVPLVVRLLFRRKMRRESVQLAIRTDISPRK